MAGWVPLFAFKKLVSGKMTSKKQLKEFTLNLPTCLKEQGEPASQVWCRRDTVASGGPNQVHPRATLQPGPAREKAPGAQGRRHTTQLMAAPSEGPTLQDSISRHVLGQECSKCLRVAHPSFQMRCLLHKGRYQESQLRPQEQSKEFAF